MTSGYLAEVSERDAAGTVAETFADIRSLLGVPVVNLVYRHLAAEEGRLESVWAALRPNLADPAAGALALSLARSADDLRPRVEPLGPEAVRRAGVSTDECRRARATLDVYERANALNLLVAHALLAGAPGSAGAEHAPAPEPLAAADILPMADTQRLDDELRRTLEELSTAVAAPGPGVLIPSLYRHLASAPGLLPLLSETIGDALSGDALAGPASAVRERARVLALALPYPVAATSDESVRGVLERFAPAMATMLVAGRIVGEALADATG